MNSRFVIVPVKKKKRPDGIISLAAANSYKSGLATLRKVTNGGPYLRV